MLQICVLWLPHRGPHIFPNLISQDQRFVREKNSRLAVFFKDRHFPHPRFAIATNLRMHVLDFVQFFLISAPTHTHHLSNTSTGSTGKQEQNLMKDPFFYGIIPLKVGKAIPFKTTKYTLCLAYQFSIFSQFVFQSCTMKFSLNVMNPTI